MMISRCSLHFFFVVFCCHTDHCEVCKVFWPHDMAGDVCIHYDYWVAILYDTFIHFLVLSRMISWSHLTADRYYITYKSHPKTIQAKIHSRRWIGVFVYRNNCFFWKTLLIYSDDLIRTEYFSLFYIWFCSQTWAPVALHTEIASLQ